MIQILVKQPCTKETFEKAVSIFKKEVKKDGFINELKDRRYFRTNAEKRKVKQEKARKKRRNY